MQRARWMTVMIAVFATACSQQVVVRTNAPDAVVKVDHVKIGKSPARFTDNNGMGKSYTVEVSAPGYETQTRVLKQEWNVLCVAASVVGGCACLIPFLGLTQCASLPQSAYMIRLAPKQGGGGRDAPAARPSSPSSPYDGPVEDEGPIIPL